MLIGEAFDFLFPLLQADRSWPNPLEVRIVDRTNLLLFQLGFDSVGQPAHIEGTPPTLLCFEGLANQLLSVNKSSIFRSKNFVPSNALAATVPCDRWGLLDRPGFGPGAFLPLSDGNLELSFRLRVASLFPVYEQN